MITETISGIVSGLVVYLIGRLLKNRRFFEKRERWQVFHDDNGAVFG